MAFNTAFNFSGGAGGGGGGGPATTDDLPEGAINQYYLDSRALSLINSTSVTALLDVTSAGSGQIITAAERIALGLAAPALQAPTTFFVDGTLGNNSNDGLSAGAGAFATQQRAIDEVASYFLGGFTHTISVANGSYPENLTLKDLVGGSCTIVGDETTPGNVALNPAGGFAVTRAAGSTGRYDFRGQRITGSVAFFLNGAFLAYRNCEFGACSSNHMQVLGNGFVLANGPYSIIGNSPRHINLGVNGIWQGNNIAVTLTGTPDFSTAFLFANGMSTFRGAVNTYTGAATGRRFDLKQNSLASTNGTDKLTYLPGNIAGLESQQGLYT